MKILLVTNLYPPNSIGGYERLCATLANALAARGHAIQVLTSAHGGGQAAPDPMPVDRALRLLASPKSIYEPFEGGSADRDGIIEANQAHAKKAVERFQPDTILAGNLMFLDGRFLEALFRLGVPLAYLLTDVWLMQMVDEPWLQQYFKREVNSAEAVDLTAVQELPADILSTVEAPIPSAEESRRTEVEARLAGGRTRYQFTGVCFLCGRTTFLAKRPTKGTLVLAPTQRTSVTCGRCGLDGSARSVIHAAALVAGAAGSRSVGVLCSDPREAQVIGGAHEGPVVSNAEALGRAREVEVVADLTSSLEAHERAVGLRPEQKLLFSSFRDSSPQRSGVSFYDVWSERYGYLGRDYRVGLRPVA